MRAFSLISILFLIPFCSSFAQDNSKAESAAIQSFKLAPSYFFPNNASQKTGRRVVDDAEVIAFFQTQKGRVMFTPSGAYIGMAVPVDEFKNYGPDVLNLKKGMEKELTDIQTRAVVLKAGFSNAQSKKRGMAPRLEEVTGGTVNFMVGPKENWRTKVPTYRKLVYNQVWDGIDLEYLGFMDHLEFRLQLEPGSDPNQIVIETGGEDLLILEDGQLVVSLAGAELVMSAPYAYQEINGETIEIPVQYQILEGNNVGFKLGNFAHNFPLVIDPTLTWSTYLGGPGGFGTDSGEAIAMDSNGNAYITGYTPKADYPTTTGAYDESWNGGQCDVFVSKLNPDGSGLSYSTFLGGTSQDYGYGIAVDTSGNAYVTGYTYSSDYPTTSGAYDETFNGLYDVFVSVLNPDGSGLGYSTFLGGTSSDKGSGIAVDASGNAYVTGLTLSSDYPTTSGAYDETQKGGSDVFVSRLSPDGSALSYSTFLGGASDDFGNGIAVDMSGDAYVVGTTGSSGYPTTSGAYDQNYNDGFYDVFVSKLIPDGSGLSYSTFLGGTGSDDGIGIAVDTSGNAYVTGYTASPDYPTTIGTYDQTYNDGSYDVFVSKLIPDGSGLSYSTFLGGASYDFGLGIAVDTSGNAYVMGETSSPDYPTTSEAYDQTYNDGYNDGSYDVFVSKLNSDGSGLSYSTFLGSWSDDAGSGVAVDTSGNAYVTGHTHSSGYPTTSGAYDETFNNGPYGNGVGFVSKLSPDGSGLSYSTFLGGTSFDDGFGIAVDNNGNAYVTGTTYSSDFPTMSGTYDETLNGNSDVFVSKLSPDGSGLSYSTFLGGTSSDDGSGIAVDNNGNAYVTGTTYSSDFPTTSGTYDETLNGYSGVFVSKLGSDGSDLIYSTFLEGTSQDYGYGIAVDASGNAYVTGYTNSSDYPTTSGAFDETQEGGSDVFVSRLNPDGSGLIYSTFLGGTGSDSGHRIAVDSSGNAYLTGYTYSSDYPTTYGAYDETYNGSSDVFVTKLSRDGSDLIYSTFLGGTGSDNGYGIAVGTSGDAFVTGTTGSSDYPTTSGAFDNAQSGGSDVFVSRLSSHGSSLSYSTFLGGSRKDEARGIAVDTGDYAYVTGFTSSSFFPTTSGAFDETYNDDGPYGNDAFVSKLSPDGSALSYSTFLGGTGHDYGYGIAVDSSGNPYVTGSTYSVDYPTTSESFDETQNGFGDAFVTKLLFYIDFNLDGCSNELDFSDLLPYWSQLIDPNHTVSVMDFLQINLDGPVPCP